MPNHRERWTDMFSKEATRLVKDLKGNPRLQAEIRAIILRGKEVFDTYETPADAALAVAELEASLVRELGYDIDAFGWQINAKKIFRAAQY